MFTVGIRLVWALVTGTGRTTIFGLVNRTAVSVTGMVPITQSATRAEFHAIVRAGIIMPTPMPQTSAIADINGGTVKIVIPSAVAVEYGIVPPYPHPTHRTEKVIERAEKAILPVKQDTA